MNEWRSKKVGRSHPHASIFNLSYSLAAPLLPLSLRLLSLSNLSIQTYTTTRRHHIASFFLVSFCRFLLYSALRTSLGGCSTREHNVTYSLDRAVTTRLLGLRYQTLAPNGQVKPSRPSLNLCYGQRHAHCDDPIPFKQPQLQRKPGAASRTYNDHIIPTSSRI